MKTEQAVYTILSNHMAKKNAKLSYNATRNLSRFIAENIYLFSWI
jgi:hypothetical protein